MREWDRNICIWDNREAWHFRQPSVYRQSVNALHLHLHLRGSHDSLRHPLHHGTWKWRLHVSEAGGTNDCLPLSHSRTTNPYTRYARRSLERRGSSCHGSLWHLRRKRSLRSRDLLQEEIGTLIK